jgi:heme/copper-type cytochrome/quinol oxidase subunit 2
MELQTIVTMVFVVGIVWGGLVTVLTMAVRKENKKQAHANVANE